MKQHISFYKIYIFRFIDFNGMQNVKQNIVNSMWRKNLKCCIYTSKSRSRSVTNEFLKISQYSQESIF